MRKTLKLSAWENEITNALQKGKSFPQDLELIFEDSAALKGLNFNFDGRPEKTISDIEASFSGSSDITAELDGFVKELKALLILENQPSNSNIQISILPSVYNLSKLEADHSIFKVLEYEKCGYWTITFRRRNANHEDSLDEINKVFLSDLAKHLALPLMRKIIENFSDKFDADKKRKLLDIIDKRRGVRLAEIIARSDSCYTGQALNTLIKKPLVLGEFGRFFDIQLEAQGTEIVNTKIDIFKALLSLPKDKKELAFKNVLSAFLKNNWVHFRDFLVAHAQAHSKDQPEMMSKQVGFLFCSYLFPQMSAFNTSSLGERDVIDPLVLLFGKVNELVLKCFGGPEKLVINSLPDFDFVCNFTGEELKAIQLKRDPGQSIFQIPTNLKNAVENYKREQELKQEELEKREQAERVEREKRQALDVAKETCVRDFSCDINIADFLTLEVNNDGKDFFRTAKISDRYRNDMFARFNSDIRKSAPENKVEFLKERVAFVIGFIDLRTLTFSEKSLKENPEVLKNILISYFEVLYRNGTQLPVIVEALESILNAIKAVTPDKNFLFTMMTGEAQVEQNKLEDQLAKKQQDKVNAKGDCEVNCCQDIWNLYDLLGVEVSGNTIEFPKSLWLNPNFITTHLAKFDNTNAHPALKVEFLKTRATIIEKFLDLRKAFFPENIKDNPFLIKNLFISYLEFLINHEDVKACDEDAKVALNSVLEAIKATPENADFLELMRSGKAQEIQNELEAKALKEAQEIAATKCEQDCSTYISNISEYLSKEIAGEAKNFFSGATVDQEFCGKFPNNLNDTAAREAFKKQLLQDSVALVKNFIELRKAFFKKEDLINNPAVLKDLLESYFVSLRNAKYFSQELSANDKAIFDSILKAIEVVPADENFLGMVTGGHAQQNQNQREADAKATIAEFLSSWRANAFHYFKKTINPLDQSNVLNDCHLKNIEIPIEASPIINSLSIHEQNETAIISFSEKLTPALVIQNEDTKRAQDQLLRFAYGVDVNKKNNNQDVNFTLFNELNYLLKNISKAVKKKSAEAVIYYSDCLYALMDLHEIGNLAALKSKLITLPGLNSDPNDAKKDDRKFLNVLRHADINELDYKRGLDQFLKVCPVDETENVLKAQSNHINNMQIQADMQNYLSEKLDKIKPKRRKQFSEIEALKNRGKDIYESDDGSSDTTCNKARANFEFAEKMRSEFDAIASSPERGDALAKTLENYVTESKKSCIENPKFKVIIEDRSSVATLKRVFKNVGLIATIFGAPIALVYSRATAGEWFSLFRDTRSEFKAKQALHTAHRIGKTFSS